MDTTILKAATNNRFNVEVKDYTHSLAVNVVDEQLCEVARMSLHLNRLDEGVVSLWSLRVHEPYQRQGIATQLVGSAIKMAELSNVILYLTAETNNPPALKLYRKLGMKRVAAKRASRAPEPLKRRVRDLPYWQVLFYLDYRK